MIFGNLQLIPTLYPQCKQYHLLGSRVKARIFITHANSIIKTKSTSWNDSLLTLWFFGPCPTRPFLLHNWVTPLTLKSDLITELELLLRSLVVIQTSPACFLMGDSIWRACGIKIVFSFIPLFWCFWPLALGSYIIKNATAPTKEWLYGLLVWPLSTYLSFSWLVEAFKLFIRTTYVREWIHDQIWHNFYYFNT